VADWLVRAGVAAGERFQVDSPLSTHEVQVLADRRYAIAMGVPEFQPARIPLAGFAQPQLEYDVTLDEDLRLRFGAVSMGNPHAVLEVPSAASAPVLHYGPALQQSASFPESVNVGFAEVVSRDHIRLRVFERGVGETLACGSGACAAAVVLMKRGRIDRDVTVALPGGDLRIQWPSDDAQVIMSGPTALVFEGEWKA